MSSPSEPNLRGWNLFTEASRIALALPVTSGVTVLIVASVCGLILATTGQTARTEADVLGRIDQAGTRLISIIDDQGTAGLSPAAVERIGRLSTVEWVIGLGYATDARNTAVGHGGTPAPVRHWWGDLPDEVVINGRQPQSGEALVGDEAQKILGFELPVGSVDIGDHQLAVVGGFASTEALGFLSTGLLAKLEDMGGARLRSIHVLATSPANVEPLTFAVMELLGVGDRTSVRFETSQTLADVRAAVAGELGRYSRVLVLVALGVGLILVAMVVYVSVTLRRQDFGRRRALGATRAAIISLIALQNALIGLGGVALGVLVGGVVVWRLTNDPPDIRFVAAVTVLTVLTVAGAAIPPAMIAAHRDPVRALRVP
ncbi:MAG: ABC transporter permease [Actinobacteria bacterium]|nr:ABC transporter permease [Actinomycetota bacterium]MCI0677892.1 ABC transporter permease [Actinomycetota bacterium]